MSQGSRQLLLVTGPARSGKSELAETLADRSRHPVTYIATAHLDRGDRDWQARIERHRQRRPKTWNTWEVPVDLPEAIAHGDREPCLLVDSLGTWVANLLDRPDAAWAESAAHLRDTLSQRAGTTILVAEETGWGVIPAYPLGRTFRDRLGHLVRDIGAIADTVYLVTGGYVLNLSALGTALHEFSGETLQEEGKPDPTDR